MKWRAAIVVVLAIAGSAPAARAADGPRLQPPALVPLPLGSIRPEGWLRRQLEIQAAGLTGHLHEFWPDVQESGWIGGGAEGWERFPYWLDGALPLAHLLDDERLRTFVSGAVDHILRHQQPDGWLGPVVPVGPDRRTRDPWPVFVALKVLTQHAEATGDDRVVPALEKFLAALRRQLDEEPLYDWNRMRWQDAVLSVRWLHDRTGADWLPELAATLRRQGFDWNTHLAALPFRAKATKWDHASHVVNVAMGLKAPAVTRWLTGDPQAHDTARQALAELDRFHGQATGMFTGDECLAGRMPAQGTETCAVVEAMFSLEQLLAEFADPAWGDRLEVIAYNALPAATSDDMWTRQYVQQANQPVSRRAPRPIYTTNGDRANLFGLETNYGCCTANMHQGWPKFTTHLWMRRGRGLAAVAHAPCRVVTVLDGVRTEAVVTTDYPFRERIDVEVTVERPVAFPLALRIPGWCTGARLEVADDPPQPCAPGTFHEVDRTWTGTTRLSLHLPLPVRVERRDAGAAVFHRGPLVLALAVDAEWRVLDGAPPRVTYEVLPTGPWNFGVLLDAGGGAGVRIEERPLGRVPFAAAEPGVVGHVRGRQLPGWELDRDAATAPPPSPVESTEPLRDLRLIPYGAAKLRITELPVLAR